MPDQLSGYGRAVILQDPRHEGGRPYFRTSGVAIADVYGRYVAGDSIEFLAEDYGIPIDQVTDALATHGRKRA